MALDVSGMVPLIQVYDMPASIHFYCHLLGFQLVTTSPLLAPNRFHWALLRLSGAELMLNSAYEFDHERPIPPDPARTAAHDDTALFFACPDVDAAFAELSSLGLTVRPPQITGYGMKQIYLHDPDGYNLCFQWPAQR